MTSQMFENKDELIKYLKENHLWTNKSLGQNFLVDNEALSRIVDAGDIKPTDTIIEIGPGLGILTEGLAKHAKKVIAVELDKKLAGLLESRIANHVLGSKVQIIQGDILNMPDTQYLIRNTNYKLIANIPYYITSKILTKFLTAENKPELIVLLVQKEVAERICARPRSTNSTDSPRASSGRAGAMSVLSVSVQAYGEPEIIDIVPASSFFPAPKVDSAILKISNIKYQISKTNEKDYFRTVKIGFAARRKTLLNNLSAGYRLDKDTVLNILKTVELNENVRAQELSIEQWEMLTRHINGILPR